MKPSNSLRVGRALRYRLPTFVAVVVGVIVAVVVLLVVTTPRYDAIAIVGLSPTPQVPYAAEVRLGAPQVVAFATNESVLTTAQQAAGAATGDLEAGDVHAELVPDTGLVQLTVSAEDPNLAARLVNELAATLVDRVDGEPLRATVVRTAEAPSSPAAPARGLYLAAGILGGLGLGLCVAVGLEAWRPRVRNASQLSELLGSPTVARLDLDAPGTLAAELRVAQLYVSRPLYGDDRGSDSVDTGLGIAVISAGDVEATSVTRVTQGLAEAFASAGYQAHLLSSKGEAPCREEPGGVRLLPVGRSSPHDALVSAQALHRALVVVRLHERAPEVVQLRQDLDAIGMDVVAGVLIRRSGRREVRGTSKPPSLTGPVGGPQG